MKQASQTLAIQTSGRHFYDVTQKVLDWVDQSDFKEGLLTLYVQHTSASLLINENYDPDVLVEELGVGQRQRVEILKVLFRGANILIFDEPTAVLVPQEVDDLFQALEGLRAQGMAVIFISHKLDEVLRVADEVTVVRQGSTVAEVKAKDVTARQLAELMVGSELPQPSTQGHTRRDEITLALKDVSIPTATGSRDLISNITFNLHAGEVVGIAGVEGNGQAELVEAIMGLRNYTGSIEFHGTTIDALSVADRHDLGIG